MNIVRIGFLAVACLMAVACQRAGNGDSMRETSDAAPPTTSATVPAPPADASTKVATQAGVDEQTALGLLNAVNEHEIALGNQALEHKVSGKVADYARAMIKAHSENMAKTTALGPTMQSPRVQQMQHQGQVEVDMLAAQGDTIYADAYIDAMVKGHQQALLLIDDTLIPAATSPAIKSHLAETRAHVQQHLAMAEELQNAR